MKSSLLILISIICISSDSFGQVQTHLINSQKFFKNKKGQIIGVQTSLDVPCDKDITVGGIYVFYLYVDGKPTDTIEHYYLLPPKHCSVAKFPKWKFKTPVDPKSIFDIIPVRFSKEDFYKREKENS